MTDADVIADLENDIDRKMQALTPDHYRRLGVSPPEPPPVTVRLPPAPGDAEVQSMLGSLLSEAFLAANSAFQRARQSGEAVELRDIHLSQGARLSKAAAMLSMALDRKRNGGKTTIYVQHIKAGQAIGVVNK